MITHWEGMEDKEEEDMNTEDSLEGGRRRKRLSKRISELSVRFEEGGVMSDSHPGGGEGEGLHATFKTINLEDKHSDILSDSEKSEHLPLFSKSKSKLTFSTNKKSSPVVSVCIERSDQLTNERRGAGIKQEGNWVTGKLQRQDGSSRKLVMSYKEIVL